jgi:uncharacterized short protein YbdD (DUF466 family)
MLNRRVAPSIARGLGGNALKDFLAPYWRSVAARRLGHIAGAIRRIFGMPDYAGYVRHLRACHPEAPVPTEKEFFSQYVTARYGDGPTRCC